MFGDIVPRFLYLFLHRMRNLEASRDNGETPWKICRLTTLWSGFFGKRMKMSNHVMNEWSLFKHDFVIYVFGPEARLYVVDGTDVHITRESDGQTASIVLVEHNVKVPCPESSEAATSASAISMDGQCVPPQIHSLMNLVWTPPTSSNFYNSSISRKYFYQLGIVLTTQANSTDRMEPMPTQLPVSDGSSLKHKPQPTFTTFAYFQWSSQFVLPFAFHEESAKNNVRKLGNWTW